MTSEWKSATARANGAKSRGPKSPETREKSSRNSLKHGFTARKTTVLECEDDDQFQEMLAEYIATYQPGSPVESNLVEEMNAAKWRMMRLRMIEVALLDSEMNREDLPTDLQPEPTDPGYQIAAAFRRLADESRALSLVSRYESRLHRIHERSHRTLRELQQTRKQQTAEPPPLAPAQPEPPVEPAPGKPAAAKPAPVQPSPTEAATPEAAPWGGAMRCPEKKSPNEPKPTSSSSRKHGQRRVIVGHRGIMRYIGSKGFRYLRQLRAA